MVNNPIRISILLSYHKQTKGKIKKKENSESKFTRIQRLRQKIKLQMLSKLTTNFRNLLWPKTFKIQFCNKLPFKLPKIPKSIKFNQIPKANQYADILKLFQITSNSVITKSQIRILKQTKNINPIKLTKIHHKII